MKHIKQNLIFYKIMKYPVPKQSSIFEFQEKLNIKNTKQDNKKIEINYDFSRNEKNKFMNSFIKKINKHGNLYKSLPFIKEIYLCNSITFNALKQDSDIDLFIVVKKGHMWRARFFSALFFKLNGLKRSTTNKKQKFCLSFYVSEDSLNLYPIMINKTDIYLSYRLAHLVPLYQENKKDNNKNNNIYQNNKRFKSLMPNHPQQHCINIGNTLFTGNNKIKKRLEFLFSGLFGKFIEGFIKNLRLPILIYKTKKLGPKGKSIIISDKMLKFHDDIREQVHLLYKIAIKT